MGMFENVRIPWPGWKVVKELGEGSYGKVYEIERTQHGITDRDALKIIRIPKTHQQYEELAYRMTDDDEEAINAVFAEQKDKVIDEISAMQKLKSSDNIVSIKDWSVEKLDDGYSWEIYIRMDVLTPLIQYVKGRNPSEDEVIRLGEDICKALIRCEEENIVHRDIKPDNIMVSEEGKFMLTDFGIARYLTDETTMTGIGSKPYMAPEVANYQKSNKTVDLYSLGLVMYELLNNFRPPFVNANGKYSALEKEAAIQRRMRGEKLPMPPGGSEDLKKVVLMACATEPSKRFGSASAMLNALKGINREKKLSSKQDAGFQSDAATEVFTENQKRTQNLIKPAVAAQAAVRPAPGKPKAKKTVRGSKKKNYLIAGSCSLLAIVLICLLAIFGQGKIKKMYKDYKETAEECGWEVDELNFIENNYAYADASRSLTNGDYSFIEATFYGDEKEFNNRIESEIKNPPNDATVINQNLTSTMHEGREHITAFKDGMELFCLSDSEEEKEGFYEFLKAFGISTEPEDGASEAETEEEEEEEEVEEGVITDISGRFLEKDKQEKFGEWTCPIYELDTKLSSPEWIDVTVALNEVSGDVTGVYEIKYRSEDKWDTLGTIEIKEKNVEHTRTYTLPLGKSVEALSIAPDTATPESWLSSIRIDRAKSRFIEGHTYTLQDDLNVRSTPGVKKDNILKREDLPGNYQAMTLDNTKDAVLKKGSKVTCQGMDGRWMKIDAGYVCVYDKEALITP